jgi:hypothetical protein
VGGLSVRRWEELCHSHLFRALLTNQGGWIFELRWWVGGLSVLVGGELSNVAALSRKGHWYILLGPLSFRI